MAFDAKGHRARRKIEPGGPPPSLLDESRSFDATNATDNVSLDDGNDDLPVAGDCLRFEGGIELATDLSPLVAGVDRHGAPIPARVERKRTMEHRTHRDSFSAPAFLDNEGTLESVRPLQRARPVPPLLRRDGWERFDSTRGAALPFEIIVAERAKGIPAAVHVRRRRTAKPVHISSDTGARASESEERGNARLRLSRVRFASFFCSMRNRLSMGAEERCELHEAAIVLSADESEGFIRLARSPIGDDCQHCLVCRSARAYVERRLAEKTGRALPVDQNGDAAWIQLQAALKGVKASVHRPT